MRGQSVSEQLDQCFSSLPKHQSDVHTSCVCLPLDEQQQESSLTDDSTAIVSEVVTTDQVTLRKKKTKMSIDQILAHETDECADFVQAKCAKIFSMVF